MKKRNITSGEGIAKAHAPKEEGVAGQTLPELLGVYENLIIPDLNLFVEQHVHPVTRFIQTEYPVEVENMTCFRSFNALTIPYLTKVLNDITIKNGTIIYFLHFPHPELSNSMKQLYAGDETIAEKAYHLGEKISILYHAGTVGSCFDFFEKKTKIDLFTNKSKKTLLFPNCVVKMGDGIHMLTLTSTNNAMIISFTNILSTPEDNSMFVVLEAK